MLELAIQFKEQLNLLLGAAIAYFGFFIQSRLNAQQSRSKLLLEKLERCYTLCQLVYDGHKREIANANKNFLYDRQAFLSSRMHPGAEMSELKMLLRCYAPDLRSFESSLDLSHKPLKDHQFKHLDNAAMNGEIIEITEFSERMQKCEKYLELLATSTAELKNKLAEKANYLVR